MKSQNASKGILGGRSQMWSRRKVLRIAESFGADPIEFEKRYREDTSRRTPLKEPSKQEINAVEGWEKEHDFKILMKALGVTNRAAANNVIVRVLEWKARGQKTG
jgi:hypothetical protein